MRESFECWWTCGPISHAPSCPKSTPAVAVPEGYELVTDPEAVVGYGWMFRMVGGSGWGRLADAFEGQRIGRGWLSDYALARPLPAKGGAPRACPLCEMASGRYHADDCHAISAENTERLRAKGARPPSLVSFGATGMLRVALCNTCGDIIEEGGLFCHAPDSEPKSPPPGKRILASKRESRVRFCYPDAKRVTFAARDCPYHLLRGCLVTGTRDDLAGALRDRRRGGER